MIRPKRKKAKRHPVKHRVAFCMENRVRNLISKGHKGYPVNLVADVQ